VGAINNGLSKQMRDSSKGAFRSSCRKTTLWSAYFVQNIGELVDNVTYSFRAHWHQREGNDLDHRSLETEKDSGEEFDNAAKREADDDKSCRKIEYSPQKCDNNWITNRGHEH
jgi:hypothetical protein